MPGIEARADSAGSTPARATSLKRPPGPDNGRDSRERPAHTRYNLVIWRTDAKCAWQRKAGLLLPAGRGAAMTIKVIETIYNGYRFRSRLEARWAVFFDSLGVSYEYEKEGFDLGSAGWYLPDFWLPEQQAWVEVKSADIDVPEPDQEKIKRLVDLSHQRAVLCRDLDVTLPVFLFTWDTKKQERSCFEATWIVDYTNGERRVRCVAVQLLELLCETWRRRRQIYAYGEEAQKAGSEIAAVLYAETEIDEVSTAYLKARQARFEHGESGISR